MAVSMKIGLAAIIAVAMHSGMGHAQATDPTDPTTQSSGTAPAVDPALALNPGYQYGVFREVVPNVPFNQRNCWVQGLVGGETINGDLLTERVTLTQAQCVLNYVTRRGLCANQRTTAFWSARQSDTSGTGSSGWNASGGSNNWQSGGSNNWQNNNPAQGGGTAQSSGGRHHGQWQNSGGSQDSDASWTSGVSQNGGGGSWNNGGSQSGGGSQNGSQWTRQGEWMQNGGVNPAWINNICSASGTSGSTGGSGAGTGSGTTTN